MRHLSNLLLSVLAVSLTGCTAGTVSGDLSAPPASSAKILNTPAHALPSELLVYLSEDASAKAEANGLSLPVPGLTSCTRVFAAGADEERMRASGLHRWHILTFSPEADIEEAAGELSLLDEVERVQFNTVMQRASDCIAYPYTPSPATRASSGAIFNDPALSSQWHYINLGDQHVASTVLAGADIHVEDVWKQITGGSREVIVAVIDEPVDYNHPDLRPNMWVNSGEIAGNGQDDDGNGYVDDIYGYNFIRNQGELNIYTPGNSGHGTHVAGTVAAVNNNGTGVSGVAGGTGNDDGVRIMSLQTFDGVDGSASNTFADAIRYAADNGAAIIQCSWGWPSGYVISEDVFEQTLEADALDYFVRENPNRSPDILGGCGIAFFSSGNEGGSVSGYPGAYRECISVAAFASDGLPTYYTNYGPGTNISAPGGEYYTGGSTEEYGCVLSTMPVQGIPIVQTDNNGNPIKDPGTGEPILTGEYTVKDYGYMQGTSMACPHAAGVAALGLSHAINIGRKFTRDEFTALVLSSVYDIDSRLNGEKNAGPGGTIKLSDYKGRMGTGAIDAWKLMMAVEGVPMLYASLGTENSINLSQYFGGSAGRLTYSSVEISDEGREAIGLEKDPEVSKYGRLIITPTRTGSAKLTVTAIAGGSTVAEGGTMGGTPISREVSVLVRGSHAGNGGWL